MIVVDSSVWIDYFTGVKNIQTNKLDDTLGLRPVAIGDLILTEVLQGFKKEGGYSSKDGRRNYRFILHKPKTPSFFFGQELQAICETLGSDRGISDT